jgi:hypothetical protein
MKRVIVAGVSLAVVLGLAGCGGDDTCCDPCDCGDLAIVHTVSECQDGPPAHTLPDPVVTGFSRDGGRVSLTIRFAANCCPGFTTVGSASGNLVRIDVVDTLAAMKCTCMFEDDFAFDWPRRGALGLSFRLYSPSPDYVGRLDTTLTI